MLVDECLHTVLVVDKICSFRVITLLEYTDSCAAASCVLNLVSLRAIDELVPRLAQRNVSCARYSWYRFLLLLTEVLKNFVSLEI